MSRRKARLSESLLSAAAAFPWWASASLALSSFFLLGHLAEYEAAPPSGTEDLGYVIFRQAAPLAARVGQFLLPLLFLVGAATSIGQRLKRAQLFAAYAAPSTSGDGAGRAPARPPGDLHSGALSWHEFQMLVGEVYRGQGYRVEETERGNDGGVDLVLRRGQERFGRSAGIDSIGGKELHAPARSRK
jgi:restriction system protein